MNSVASAYVYVHLQFRRGVCPIILALTRVVTPPTPQLFPNKDGGRYFRSIVHRISCRRTSEHLHSCCHRIPLEYRCNEWCSNSYSPAEFRTKQPQLSSCTSNAWIGPMVPSPKCVTKYCCAPAVIPDPHSLLAFPCPRVTTNLPN